jgi:hypothetical protein
MIAIASPIRRRVPFAFRTTAPPRPAINAN